MTDYDAIVIGSGSGGLTSALALARAGRRVVVFEQHTLPGGYSQSFTLNGCSFSPGIHYVGALQPGGGLRRIYEGLGVANRLVFFELNPDGYDHVRVGDERFDIPKGKDRFRDRLKQRFPSEAAGIDGYFDLIGRMADELGWAHPIESLSDAVLLPVHAHTILRYGMMPLGHFIDRFTTHPMVRAILTIQAGDHAMAPSKAPTALHAGLQSYYFDGGCYPQGGGHAIPDALIAELVLHGGNVVLGTEVAQILVADGRAIGVRLADGREVRADIVVSNADPGVTWGQLIAPTHLGWALRRRIERTRYSLSTISLFLGVDMDLRAAGLDSGNVWYSRTTDIDAVYQVAELADISTVAEIPGLFLNATTLKDPTLRNDGIHTVEAMALSSMQPFEAWRNTQSGNRPAAYRSLKARLKEKMLDAVAKIVPGVRDHVVTAALGTPLTNMHYLHATAGAIYGTEKTVGNLGPLSFPVRTHIPGLFQCGASTIAPGINGVTTSGLEAAAAALGCEREDLLTARGQRLRIYSAEDPSQWPSDLQLRSSRGGAAPGYTGSGSPESGRSVSPPALAAGTGVSQ